MLPPYIFQSTIAANGAADAIAHPASNTSALADMRPRAGMGCCDSSLSAPLWRSPATSRIATNGSRNAAASSQALKVGAQMPTSGENASPTPAAVPPRPLASPYVRTAWMNEKPTSGPMSARKIHHDFDAISSRHSLSRSQTNTNLREGKEDFLEIRRSAGAAARRRER